MLPPAARCYCLLGTHGASAARSTDHHGQSNDGRPFGRVRAVENYGAGDLLAIDRPDGPPVSLPFTDRVVPVVDLAGRRIVVDPPAGLLDEAKKEEGS